MSLEFCRILTVVASFLITIGLYDQSIKIWCTKSAKDFTLTIVISLIFSELAWLNYGLALQEWPIIFISSINIPAVLLCMFGYFRYRKGA